MMKTLLLIWGVTCGGDAGVSSYALAQGGHELLLPSQSPWVVSTIVSGQAIAGTVAIQQLDQRGHPRWARTLGWTLVAVRGAAVGWNLHQVLK